MKDPATLEAMAAIWKLWTDNNSGVPAFDDARWAYIVEAAAEIVSKARQDGAADPDYIEQYALATLESIERISKNSLRKA